METRAVSADYRSFEHTADIGIEAWGDDLPALFSNAARALFDVAVDLASIRPDSAESVELQAEAVDLLLHAWLSELLYRFSRGRVYAAFEFETLTQTSLKARIHGEEFDRGRHGLKTDIKAVTYHQLLAEKGDRWHARAILDL
jgi:SHS2 domain-containing protein